MVGLATGQISWLTIWLVFGTAPKELRWIALVLGSVGWAALLEFAYNVAAPARTTGTLFFWHAILLIGCLYAWRSYVRRFAITACPEEKSLQGPVRFDLRSVFILIGLVAVLLTAFPMLDVIIGSYGNRFFNEWKFATGLASAVCGVAAVWSGNGTGWKALGRLIISIGLVSMLGISLVWLFIDEDIRRLPCYNIDTTNFRSSDYRSIYLPWPGLFAFHVAFTTAILLIMQHMGIQFRSFGGANENRIAG